MQCVSVDVVYWPSPKTFLLIIICLIRVWSVQMLDLVVKWFVLLYEDKPHPWL